MPSLVLQKPQSEEEFNKLKAKFELPMIFLTLLLLAIIIVRVSFTLPPATEQFLDFLDVLIWLAFTIELVLMTYFALDKKKYLKHHWYDVMIVLLPSLRVTRLFRVEVLFLFQKALAEVFGLLGGAFSAEGQLVRVFPLLARGGSNAKRAIKKYKLNSIIFVMVSLVLVLGPLGAVFESQDPNSNIDSLSDGVWWGIVSVTTVGYGDLFPVTLPGRIIGVILMTLGVVVFSLITASIASKMVEKEESKDRKKIHKQLSDIEKHLESIEQSLDQKNSK